MKRNMLHLRTFVLTALVVIFALGIAGTLSGVAMAQRAAITKNVDEPGRVPYQVFLSGTTGPASGCGTNFCSWVTPDVPAGKRLVITNYSATVNLDSTATAQNIGFAVYDSSSSLRGEFRAPAVNAYSTDELSFDRTRRYVVNEQLLYFVEAGQHLHIHFWTSGGSLSPNSLNEVLITGYLVDLAM